MFKTREKKSYGFFQENAAIPIISLLYVTSSRLDSEVELLVKTDHNEDLVCCDILSLGDQLDHISLCIRNNSINSSKLLSCNDD